MRIHEINQNQPQQLDEAAALWPIIQSLIAKWGVRKFAMWLLRWLFTTATGLTAMAILAVVQLIAGLAVQLVTGVSTSVLQTSIKQIKKLMDKEGEDGDRVMSELESELRMELDKAQDDPDSDDMDDISPEELVMMAKDTIGDMEMTPATEAIYKGRKKPAVPYSKSVDKDLSDRIWKSKGPTEKQLQQAAKKRKEREEREQAKLNSK